MVERTQYKHREYGIRRINRGKNMGRFSWFVKISDGIVVDNGKEDSHAEAEAAAKASIDASERRIEQQRQRAVKREILESVDYRGVKIHVEKRTNPLTGKTTYLVDPGWGGFKGETLDEALNKANANIDMWHSAPMDANNPLQPPAPKVEPKPRTVFVDDGFDGEIVMHKAEIVSETVSHTNWYQHFATIQYNSYRK